MKAIKYLAAATINFGIIVQLHSQGQIVPMGVVSNFGGFFSPQEIDVLHDPANPNSPSSYTGFSLEPNGKTPPSLPFANIFSFDPVLDVGVRVFFVSPGDPISFQQISAQSYPELTSPNSYVFNAGMPVYLGLYTGNVQFAPPDGIYGDPLFGWAELVNHNGVIQLVDSALEYQGGGIFAGTENIIPIPEPGIPALAVLGMMLLSFRRWRKPPKRRRL